MTDPRPATSPTPEPPIRELAQFRYRLRTFLRFSERAARAHDITPLQHQLLLGTAGFTGRGWATISELAEFLQRRHNGVVALVNRAARSGLVKKSRLPEDRRTVRVDLTPRGRRVLVALSRLHEEELARIPLYLERAGRASTSGAGGGDGSR